MPLLYLFFIVLGQAIANEFLSNFKSADLVSQLIAEQRRKCPYIALCHTPNSSVFRDGLNVGYYSPCCKECSCNDTCIEDGSCCPDYFTKDNSTKTVQPLESTTVLVATTKVIDLEECVKIQHGPIQNRKGFMMVASCPPSYDDIVVKRKCEMKLDYHLPFDLFDHVPVTDRDRGGQIYKNRHCGQCNMLKDSSATFWHILLTCRMTYFYFNMFPVEDLSTFVETVSLDKSKSCNIVFQHEASSINVNDTPTICTYNTMVDTCNNITSSYDLQTLCKQYTWPIEAYVFPESRLYKNYACMLCNGVTFQERCRRFTDSKTITIHFTSDFNSTKKLTTSSNKSIADRKTINRYFPNPDGEIHCQMGFIYDIRKRTCRLVLCPQYFIISDGECVPLFANLDVVDYCLLLQADVTSVKIEPNEELEVSALTKSFYNIFHEHLDDALIEFSIWRNQNLPVKNRYFVKLSVSGNFSQARYISILNFTNNIIQHTHTFNENLSVVFGFNVTTALYQGCRFTVQIENDKFLLLNTYKRKEKDASGDFKTPMYISPALFCYRISLTENEVKRIGISHTSVLKKKIHNRNLQTKNENGVTFIVCLDQGLENVDGTINVFLIDKSTNYTFISKQKVIESKNKIPKTFSDVNESEDLNKSLVATFATVAFISFVVIFRRVMKRRVAEQTQTQIVEYVSERNIQIAKPHCENSNEGDAVVTRKAMPTSAEES